MERITERDKLKALLEKTGCNVEVTMSNVVTCQSFSGGIAVITEHANLGDSDTFFLNVISYDAEHKSTTTGTFDECNALMTEITK